VGKFIVQSPEIIGSKDPLAAPIRVRFFTAKEGSDMKVNAVFEGGGVKAIGLVGAVQAAEQHGFSFHQVAGTSSGSMVAAFLAAGYTSMEMEKLILDTPFTSFLQRAPVFNIKVIGPVARLMIKKGLYSGEQLEHWVAQVLIKKGIRTFADLQPNQLRIIASDISRGRLLVLPDDIAQYGIDPNSFTVAKAIRMSTSIPYFFDPVMIRKSLYVSNNEREADKFKDQFIYIVDGGILSNFPMWLFDEKQDPSKVSSLIPTLGFQLVGKKTKTAMTIRGPFTMFEALFTTMMDAHDERYIEDHDRFRTIKIPTVGVKTTQFDIDKETNMKLFESGREAGDRFFNKWSLNTYIDQYKQFFNRTS
jgi:NTE family protein